MLCHTAPSATNERAPSLTPSAAPAFASLLPRQPPQVACNTYSMGQKSFWDKIAHAC